MECGLPAGPHSDCPTRHSPNRTRTDPDSRRHVDGIVLGILIVALATTVLALNTGIGTFLGKVTTKLSSLIS